MRIDLFSFVHFDFEVKQMHFNASFSLLIEEVDKKNVSKQSNSATEKKNNLNFSVVTTDEEQCFSTHQKRTKKNNSTWHPKKRVFDFIFLIYIFSSKSFVLLFVSCKKNDFFSREYKFIPVSFDVAFFLGSDIIYISLMQQEFSIVCFFG